MPEYLAPGVYVEEIDTGSKPIEGVSTSTAGMLGVTERGPMDVPILITSYGEYVRWFGERLNHAEYSNATGFHCYLPYAVEGFFTNGGKRVFITRVLNRPLATNANTFLFDRNSLAGAPTYLLRGSRAADTAIVVADGAGLAADRWIRIGEGADTEYRQVNGLPATANEVVLRLPLRFPHVSGGAVAVDHFAALTSASTDTPQLDTTVASGTSITISGAGEIAGGNVLRLGTLAAGDEEFVRVDSVALPAAPAARVVTLSAGTPVTISHTGGAGQVVDILLGLAQDVEPGDLEITVIGEGAIPANSILRLGTLAAGDEEYVIVASVAPPAGPAPRVATLSTPVLLSHPGGLRNAVEVFSPLGAPAVGHTTSLSSPAVSGDTLLLVANHTNFTNAEEFVRITDGAQTELRRIGRLGAVALTLPAYADYPAGSVVDVVTRADQPFTINRSLVQDAAAGSNILVLNDRTNLVKGEVLRVGQDNDTAVEYVTIADFSRRLPPPDAGTVVLSAPLQRAHPGDPATGTQVRQQRITGAAPAMARLTLGTRRNSTQLIVSDTTGITTSASPQTTILRVTVGSGTSYYHRGDTPVTALTPTRVVMKPPPLGLPHLAEAAVVAREPLLLVQALDPGGWGDRLRVSAQDHDPPLLDTKIRLTGGIPDSTHLRLDSANGVEVGTILLHVDGLGNVTSLKVIGIDRQNGYLLELDPAHPLPAGAAPGDTVRSHEFQLDVYLLRQPDPSLPSRDETLLDIENFRYLSLDPRHSRYVHKVIGTTWDARTVGTTADDDGQPLRLSDRRSEGESRYIRVRDQVPAESIRLGPELLTDLLPTGGVRATRLRLLGGDDAVNQINDETYTGKDAPEPENRTGLHSLKNIEEISIVACPGRTTVSIQNALINHCELMRYRFAVLDAQRPPRDSIADVVTQRQQFDTKYAALYHPWLSIPDPYPITLARIQDYAIPPSGHMVGIYARVDIERGVHKAPANEVVRGIVGLQRRLNKEQQDILNPYPVNINVIRDFRPNNRGIRVFGGRVITSDSDWKYVNVRRLLIFIEASIDRGLQWVVFEPNAEPLWARVRRSISNFLTLVWRNGALEGTKVEEAYFVKCDRTTMTQTDIDQGRLICVVGVAPVKPAEFVIIRIGLWTAHAED